MFFTQIDAGSIKSKPVNMHFGKRHVFKVVGAADVSSSLNDVSFKMDIAYPTANNEDSKINLVPWFNVGGAGSEPTIVDAQMLEVAIDEDASLNDVYAAMKLALDALPSVKLCWIENGAIYIESMFFGISDGSIDVDSSFTLSDHMKGFGGFLGGTEGGANISPEIATEEITTDQTGTSPLAEIIQSTKFTVSTTMKELSPKRMELLFGNTVGEVYTPTDGTKIIGMGTSKVGSNSSAFAGELIMKPVSKEATDHSENIHFFSCAILPSGLVYGSEQIKTEVTFNVYVDSTKDTRANIGCFGDGFQDLRPE